MLLLWWLAKRGGGGPRYWQWQNGSDRCVPILLIRIALLLLARDAARIPLRVAFDRDMRGMALVGPMIAAGGRDMVSFCRCVNEF